MHKRNNTTFGENIYWNAMYNRELYEKNLVLIGGEFVFFPCLDDEGMIANPDLFYGYVDEDENEVESQEPSVSDEDLEHASGNVSKYFTWGDTVVTNHEKYKKGNKPNAIQRTNIVIAAKMLDKFREAAGVPFTVTSWYRSEELNSFVNGVPNSDHRIGLAIDVKPVGISARQLWIRAKHSGLPFGQLILYNSFVHFGFNLGKNKNEELVIQGVSKPTAEEEKNEMRAFRAEPNFF